MKRLAIVSLVTALLGGCAVVPAGYGYYGDGWGGHRHYRDDGPRRDGGYYYPRYEPRGYSDGDDGRGR